MASWLPPREIGPRDPLLTLLPRFHPAPRSAPTHSGPERRGVLIHPLAPLIIFISTKCRASRRKFYGLSQPREGKRRAAHSAHVRRGARGAPGAPAPPRAPAAAARAAPAPGRPRAPGRGGARADGAGGTRAAPPWRPRARAEVAPGRHRLVSIHYHTAYFSG